MEDQQVLIRLVKERKLIDAYVKNRNKQRKRVPADGHCILHAVSLALTEVEDGSDHSVQSLLCKIKEELLGNMDLYSPFVGDIDVVSELDSYIYLKHYNSAVVDLILTVLANVTQASIVVLLVQQDEVCEISIPTTKGTSRRTMYVSKIGQHYDAILDKEAGSPLNIEGKPEICCLSDV